MTNKQKSELQWTVRYYMADGKADYEIIDMLQKRGYKKSTIKIYIKAFSKE